MGIAPGGPNTGKSMYNVCQKSINYVVESHVEFYKGFTLTVPDKFKCLPYFHWLPKLHKTPYGSCFIAASSRCTTTLVSKILTACLGLVRKRQQVYYDAVYRNSGIKGYWLIQNSDEVSELVSKQILRVMLHPSKRMTLAPFIQTYYTLNLKSKFPS